MAPLVESWSPQELPLRAQINPAGKVRKGFNGDLTACELLELLQYNCEVEKPVTRDSAIRCRPVERLFRRCQDSKGSFTVETTAWERRNDN